MLPARFVGSTDPRDLSAPRNALSQNLRVFGAEFSGVATKHPSNRLLDHRLDYRVFRNPRRSALVRHRGLSHHVDWMFDRGPMAKAAILRQIAFDEPFVEANREQGQTPVS